MRGMGNIYVTALVTASVNYINPWISSNQHVWALPTWVPRYEYVKQGKKVVALVI
jgi:hypothetical protein